MEVTGKFLVKNEITGTVSPIHEDVYLSQRAYEDVKRLFELFVKYSHNKESKFSCEVYMDLYDAMYNARQQFNPFRNAWYIAKKGYSLN